MSQAWTTVLKPYTESIAVAIHRHSSLHVVAVATLAAVTTLASVAILAAVEPLAAVAAALGCSWKRKT